MPDTVGEGQIRIVPDVSGFETQLRAQLQPILDRVGAQMAPSFARTGQQAGQAFGRNLAAGVSTEVSRTVPAAVNQAAGRASRQISAAGTQSGRVFGTGFGEGFAALAAFAIASRVRRFFTDTVQDAVQFETAFAGVRRVVEGTAEQFDQLRQSVIGMSERLPFTAKAIADTAAELGRIGVARTNLEAVSETVLKFATITGQAPEQVATSLSKFISVTQSSFEDAGHLTDVILKLGTAFAASEQEVLAFSARLNPLAATTKLTAEDVLALSTGIVQAGGRAESGGTAITQAFNQIQKAANEGGVAALNFSRVIGVDSVQAFQRLVENDPTEAFVRLLEGIQQSGTQSAQVLDDLGLGSVRISTQLRALAASSDVVRDALSKSRDAAGELDRQFKIFSETPAARFQKLQNAIENTRIEIGGKLAPALIGILKPIAGLETSTVSLAAAFAGLTAGGFAFTRFGNIFREFQKTLGGTALSAEELTIALRIQQQTGASLSTVLRATKAENLSLAQAQTAAADTTSKLSARLAAQNVEALGLVGAFKSVQATLLQQRALAATPATIPGILGPADAATSVGGFRAITGAANEAALAQERFSLALQTTKVGFFETASAAFTAVGGFGAVLGVVGKIAAIAIVADIVGQALEGLAKQIIDIGQTPGNLQQLPIDLEAIAVASDTAAERIKNVNQAITDAGININAIRLEEATKGVEGLTINFEFLTRTLNKIPVVGSLIPDSFVPSKKVEEDLKKVNDQLIDFLGKVGPGAAAGAAKLLTDRLLAMGASAGQVENAFKPFNEALDAAEKHQGILGISATDAAKSLAGMGLNAADSAAALQGVGISGSEAASGIASASSAADAAASAFSRLQGAQKDLQSRVQALIRPVSGIISLYEKQAKAAGKSGKDTRTSARAIADAEKALARAREEAADRIADAQRRLAEAERDAIERILDARRRLEESRIDSTRSLRDATENLQDFEQALAQVGGPRTQEDFIRLRELQEALADATEDAAQREIEGQRAVQEARDDGARKIEESQRRLAEVIEENQQRIADALERLARAHEDAHGRAAAAAAKAADKIVLSTAQITKGFRDRARQLNIFAGSLEALFPRLTRVFGDQNLAEAFLADLNEMGTDAIPILKNLVGSSDKQLAGLGKAFESQIKAAKRAADLQFKRFPPNFKQAIAPALDNIEIEIERGLDAFDSLSDKGSELATSIDEDTRKMAQEFIVLSSQADGSLSAMERKILEVGRRNIEFALSLNDPIERTTTLRKAIDLIKNKEITILADAKLSPRARELQQLLAGVTNPQLRAQIKAEQNLTVLANIPVLDRVYDATKSALKVLAVPRAMGGTITAAQFGASIRHAQFGSTSSTGQPLIVGERGTELFIPNQGGAVFKHSDTERILRALRVGSRGGFTQINVNEVGSDPIATARAVSFRIGSGQAIR